MLIKVNSLIYKTKINVKITPKIKITYVLILNIFLVSMKSNKKTNKKAGSSNGLSPKFGPSMKRNPSESINSQSLGF